MYTFISGFSIPFHVITPSWASPLISVLYVHCLFHLFLHIQSASPIMCPQHTPQLSFHVFTVSDECNPFIHPLPKPETTGLSWTPFFLSYPTFSPLGTPSPAFRRSPDSSHFSHAPDHHHLSPRTSGSSGPYCSPCFYSSTPALSYPSQRN